MGWLGNLRRRRAAKAYVFKLGPWLRRACGASRTYTAGQIERGAHELHLNPRFIVFGHAVFLDPTEFASIHGILPNAVTIEEARAALWRDLGAPPQFDPASSIGDAEGWGLGGSRRTTGAPTMRRAADTETADTDTADTAAERAPDPAAIEPAAQARQEHHFARRAIARASN